MPHLSPMFWLLIPLLAWLFLFMFMMNSWYQLTPTLPPLTPYKNNPTLFSMWKWN